VNTRLQFNPGVLVTIIFSLVYACGASVGPQASDSAEFMMVAGGGGRLHPPGYPILHGWLYLWQFIPFGSVAWKSSMACGLLGALSIGFLTDAIYRWLGEIKPAIWCAAMLGVQPLWIRYCTIAEAFTIAALVYAALFWLSVRVRKERSVKMAIYLGLIFSLGIASHHVFLFALPLYGWILWQLRNHFVWVLGFSLLGFLMYLPLFSSEGVWVWGNLISLSDMVHFFLRSDYGSFQITHSTMIVDWWVNPVSYLLVWSRDSWGVLPILLAVSLLVNRSRYVMMLWATWLSVSVVFFSLFSLPFDGEFAVHTQRFFMAPTLLSIPLAAIGVQYIVRILSPLGQLLLFIVPAVFALLHIPTLSGRFDKRMEDYFINACSVLPVNSLVFVEGDGAIFGLNYMQKIEGFCPDVKIVVPGLLNYPWYLPELKERTITEIIQTHSGDYQFFASLSILGRDQQSLPPAVPYGGTWMRFVETSEMLPTPLQTEVHLLNTMSDFRYHPTANRIFLWERAGESWASSQYAHSWIALGSAYFRADKEDDANRCIEIGEALKKGDWFE
jgi:hypothetical protein